MRSSKSLILLVLAILLTLVISGCAANGQANADRLKKLSTQTVTSGDNYPAPKVTGEVADNKILLKWQPIDHPESKGYKVVVSKNNANPKYPDDGYLYFITDKNTTSAVVDIKDAYNGGDFGDKLVPGEAYYFSVTAVYEKTSVPGNAIQLTYPKTEVQPAPAPEQKPAPKPIPAPVNTMPAPNIKAYVSGNKVVVSWNRIDSPALVGYKVVISKNNSAPIYNQDGYLAWITDRNVTSWAVDNSKQYNGGDIGGYLQPGQAYYFSVTAIYNKSWDKVRGNAVRVAYPTSGYYPTPERTDPVSISSTVSGSDLVLSWPKVTTNYFVGYKVVISKNNANPKYPDDGYLQWITDRNTTSIVVNSNTYYGGDINGKLVSGEKYYFSISVIYSPWVIVPGPAVQVAVP